MAERKGKRTFIALSSSSEGEEEDEEDWQAESGDNGHSDDEDDEEEEDGNKDDDDIEDDDSKTGVSISSDGGSVWSGEEEESDDHDESADENADDDDKSRCNRVIRLLNEESDLQALTLKECKAYLRKHGLRITGTKVVCVQRIKEHWKIKDGHGEVLYPRSSFVINCTGDVCKGDAVLFMQTVYAKFDKVTRSGHLRGKRTIAGRVVKESYGADKQQHTFTVEVLWSKGIRKLLPLAPLLVKGRNLYRMKTFRQRWNSEAERAKVLAEKHKRGREARIVRAKKRTEKTSLGNGGAKRQKHYHHAEPSQARRTTEVVRNHVDKRIKTQTMEHATLRNHPQKVPPVGQSKLKQIKRSRSSKSSPRHYKHAKYEKDRVTSFQWRSDAPRNFYPSQIGFHHGNASRQFPSYDMNLNSTMMRLPPSGPHDHSSVIPPPEHQAFNHRNYFQYANSEAFNHRNYFQYANSDPDYGLNPRMNGFPRQMDIDRHLRSLPSGTDACGYRNNRFGAGQRYR